MTHSEQQLARPEPGLLQLLAFVNPMVTLAGILIGGVYGIAGAVLVLGIYPVLEGLLGETGSQRERQGGSRFFESLLWLHGLFHFAVLAALFWRAHLDGLQASTYMAGLSAGINAGASAVITAHELGHQPPRSAGWRLARVILFSVNYAHFTTEHNHNHHKHVATEADPASATAGQGLWLFLYQTIPGQFLSAISIHRARGRRGLGNPVLRGVTIQALLLLASLVLPSLIAGGFQPAWTVTWLLMSAVSILLLEYVNYIQHWGLRREPGERQTAYHSWQSHARLSRWTLLELPLHPAHHLKAARPYWQLTVYEGAPTLPSGYYGCFWAALLPPLWRAWMAPRLPSKG